MRISVSTSFVDFSCDWASMSGYEVATISSGNKAGANWLIYSGMGATPILIRCGRFAGLL